MADQRITGTDVWYDASHKELRAYHVGDTPAWVEERFTLIGRLETPLRSDIHLFAYAQPRLALLGFPKVSMTFYNYGWRGTAWDRVSSTTSTTHPSTAT